MELPRSTLTSGNNTATNGPQKLPLEIRSAIVTLHFAADQSWSEISAHLKVDPGTAQRVCERAKERAADPTDIRSLLRALEPCR